MQWYNCKTGRSWGIEISAEGVVTQVVYKRGDEQRVYEKQPQVSEHALNEEVLDDAFEDIIRYSDEGTHYLAHHLKGQDANTLFQTALFQMERMLAVMKSLARENKED